MTESLMPDIAENRILAGLPVNERARLTEDLEQVTVPPFTIRARGDQDPP